MLPTPNTVPKSNVNEKSLITDAYPEKKKIPWYTQNFTKAICGQYLIENKVQIWN